MLVIDAEVHEQVRWQLFQFEVVALHGQLRALAHVPQQCVHEGALRKGRTGAESRRAVGQRHQPGTRALVQRFHQRQHLCLQHAGHEPFAALFADLVERVDRHGHGDAVLGVARFVQVGGDAVDATQPQRLRECGRRDAGGFVAHQLVARQVQRLRVALDLFTVPAFQQCAAVHVGRQLLVVEGVDEFVVHQHVLPPRLVFQVLHLLDQLLVVRQERQPRFPVAGHQGFADEHRACRHRIDMAEVHALVVVDHDAVKRRALERHHFAGLLFPVRFQQLLFQQVAGHRRYPLRLDRRQPTAEEPCCVDEFCRHQPARRLLAEVRPRVAPELDAACTQIPIFVLTLAADVPEQPRQQ